MIYLLTIQPPQTNDKCFFFTNSQKFNIAKKKYAMKDFYVFCLQRITFFHSFAHLLVSITIRIVVVFSVVAYQKNTVKNK